MALWFFKSIGGADSVPLEDLENVFNFNMFLCSQFDGLMGIRDPKSAGPAEGHWPKYSLEDNLTTPR